MFPEPKLFTSAAIPCVDDPSVADAAIKANTSFFTVIYENLSEHANSRRNTLGLQVC
jgi:hypothetical protein